MKYLLALSMLLLLSGCGVYHMKKCLPPDRQDYQACHHVVEWWTEAACTGSCDKK